MADLWHQERIFLTVKAYPSISKKHHEACCMAGITAKGDWIRLYPVFFRDLEDEQKFNKYTWIEASVKKSNDFREESYYVDPASIRVVENVPTDGQWSRRNAIILPKLAPAAAVFAPARELGRNTLTLIKPSELVGLEIDQTPDEDFERQVQNMNDLQQQLSLIPTKKIRPLELVPYSFRYDFIDDNGDRHKLKIVDWEIYQLYRNCRHRSDWEELIRQKFHYRTEKMC